MANNEGRIVLTDADTDLPADERPKDTRCPRCSAKTDRRVLSAGFGEPHDVCGRCGYDFPERTL